MFNYGGVIRIAHISGIRLDDTVATHKKSAARAG
jgi:hypothetical protein